MRVTVKWFTRYAAKLINASYNPEHTVLECTLWSESTEKEELVRLQFKHHTHSKSKGKERSRQWCRSVMSSARRFHRMFSQRHRSPWLLCCRRGRLSPCILDSSDRGCCLVGISRCLWACPYTGPPPRSAMLLNCCLIMAEVHLKRWWL